MSQSRKIIVVVVLAVVLVGVIVFQFTRKAPGPPKIAKATTQSAVTNPAASPASKGRLPANPTAGTAAVTGTSPTTIKHADVDIDSLLSGIKEVDFDYDKDREARDPMAPLVGKVANLAMETEKQQDVPPATVGQVLNKVVTGIVWDVKTPVAVVDNEVVYPGYEYADGTTVASIQRDRVVFKVGDSPIEVKLKEL